MKKSFKKCPVAVTLVISIMFWVSCGHAQDNFVESVKKEMTKIAEEISDRIVKQDRALETAIEAGNLSTLTTPEDITKRIEIMEKVIGLSEEAISIIKAAPALIAMSETFQHAQQSEKERAMNVAKNSLKSMNMDILVQKMQTDRRWAMEHIKRLRLLKDNTRLWSYNQQKKFIDSGDENFIKRFNEYTNEINRLQGKASELIKQYKGQ